MRNENVRSTNLSWLIGLRFASLVWPGTVIVVLWLGVFQVFRALLLAATFSRQADLDSGLIAQAFLHGLRFDLSVAFKVFGIFGLWQIWRQQSSSRRERIFAKSAFAVVSAISVFVLIVEIEFYKEFQMRLNSVMFQFFSADADNNATIIGMIWHGYPVVRWMAVWGVISAAVIWIGTRALERTNAPSSFWLKTAASLTWIGILVVCWRGGLQQTPLRWGNAIFSQNTYANQLAENGVFALIDCVKSQLKPAKSLHQWKRLISLEDATRVVRQVTLQPGESLVQPNTFPLLRVSPPTEGVLTTRPKNVVLVLMESFTARFCGAIGANFGATPNFDALAREGVLFDRAFSVGTHTAQGVFGTLCSFPNLPEFDGLMKHPLGHQRFRSLPQIFYEERFSTIFLYNGLFSWDNKEGFFRNQGVQRFVGRWDYANPVFVDPAWGVSDLDVFNRAITEFDQLSEAGQPFCGMILTLSNHAPFNLPKIAGLEPILTGGEQNKRLNGVHYADWALGQFMQMAKSRRWYEETLFVFCGDHGFAIPPTLTEASILHAHVPLLFFGPMIRPEARSVRHTVASQLDILPTIIGLFGLKSVHQSFGRNLFLLPENEPGHALMKRSGSMVPAWIEGDRVAIKAPDRAVSLHEIDLGFPPNASIDVRDSHPAEAAAMERKIESWVVVGLNILEKRLAAPP